MKVLVYSTKAFERPLLEKANQGRLKLHFTSDALSSYTAIQAAGFEGVSLFSGDDASLLVLEKLYDLGVRYISIRAAGYNNIHVKAAKRLGFKVANVPRYSPHAIAEHAVGILLSLIRRIREATEQVQQNNFELSALKGLNLNGSTVGIIGTGNIGSVMARLMHAFGCKVLANDLVEDGRLTEEYGVTYVPLDTLLEKSDIVSLHVPLTYETHYLINEGTLAKMKTGAYLVNTARGAVVKTTALIKALEEGKLGGYAADVYEKERDFFFRDFSRKGIKDELFLKLIALPNVLMTPHMAFMTETALDNIAVTTLENLIAWDQGKVCPNELGYESVIS